MQANQCQRAPRPRTPTRDARVLRMKICPHHASAPWCHTCACTHTAAHSPHARALSHKHRHTRPHRGARSPPLGRWHRATPSGPRVRRVRRQGLRREGPGRPAQIAARVPRAASDRTFDQQGGGWHGFAPVARAPIQPGRGPLPYHEASLGGLGEGPGLGGRPKMR